MALEEAFAIAMDKLHKQGGVVTVVLGTGVDAPTDWTYNPGVHWVQASELKRNDIPGAIPTNTRLMLFTDNIHGNVFQPLHNERKRRRIPYMVRKTGNAVAEALTEIFPKKIVAPTDVFSPAIPGIEEGNGNGNGNGNHDHQGAQSKAPKGSLKAWVEKNIDLTPNKTNAEEARRLFQLAQHEGVQTTLMSLQQSITVWKRQHGVGSRPESLAPAHVNDVLTLTKALEQAIATLSDVKSRVENMDADHDKLRKENTDLKARIDLMRDAFAGLG